MADKLEYHVAYIQTHDEADYIARYLNNQGIPTVVGNHSMFGYSIYTNKEQQFKAQLIYLLRLQR